MEIQKLFKKLQSGQYAIKLIVECWCDFNWQLVDGVLTASDAHEDHYFLNRLVVDGEAVAEYDYTRKDITMHQDISQKDLPKEIMLDLEKDISRSCNIPWNVEHDDFRKAGALVSFIQEKRYAVEMWGNFFLMVDYGQDVNSWKDSHKWANRFLSAEGPLENRNAYFIFVDNTKFNKEFAPA